MYCRIDVIQEVQDKAENEEKDERKDICDAKVERNDACNVGVG